MENEECIFVPHELKTIEVDVEKKIFRVNGKDFGDGCTGFAIKCSAGARNWFTIRMKLHGEVKYVGFDQNGDLNETRTYKRKYDNASPMIDE